MLAETGAISEPGRYRYVASADGEKFLVLSPMGREQLLPTTVVLN